MIGCMGWEVVDVFGWDVNGEIINSSFNFEYDYERY